MGLLCPAGSLHLSFTDIAKLVSREIKALSDKAAGPMTLEWKAGETIIDKGKTGNYMFLVVCGEADIRMGGEVIETVGPDGIVGEMALIDSPERSATVIAKTDIVLNPIDRWKFQYLTRKYPDFALFIMEVISRRLRRMNRRMDDDV